MKIRLSKIIEIFTFLGLIIGLVFQYQEIADSKEEITKLDKIVSDIQNNTNKLHEQEIARIEAITEQVKNSSEMYQTLMSIDISNKKAIYNNFEDLLLSLQLSNEAYIASNSEWLSHANNLQVALIQQMYIFQEWQKEINETSDIYSGVMSKQSSNHNIDKNTAKLMEATNEDLLRNLSVINGRYSELIKPYIEKLNKQRNLVLKILSQT
ncbi:hypothetical protein C9J44_20040 [Photobacterium sp. GB-27]|uniref:hypothetical protein n=1 Tax=unclassified Photobacterium TaxID=2628852 RepID=UPI000D15AB2F|nr:MULTISPECIES: hypothetical protein [unclassified Photobacterium]PSV31128.1 hypothetical protein C9J44_20040 [Photobacterium sp. GB-27]PSW75119.1 hypothetical protein C9J41_00265 [Photobacterium sp. GB-50]